MASETEPAAREPLLTGPLLLRFATVAAAALGFFLPFSALPRYVEPMAGPTVAGSANTALLVATVLAEIAAPRLLPRVGDRLALAFGLILMGAPALLLLIEDPAVVLIGCVLRGLGFGLTVVAGGSLTASLLPPSRRAEGLALVGVVSGVPGVLGLPAGVWIADNYGYDTVFILTALIPVTAVVTVPWLPSSKARRAPVSPDDGGLGFFTGLRRSWIRRPAVIFAISAAVAGAVTSFLPLATRSTWPPVAPLALLTLSLTGAMVQIAVGRFGDRRDHQVLIRPALIIAALGTVVMMTASWPPLLLVGAASFGLGFGTLQNATFTAMYKYATPRDYGAVVAIWNAAYDGGMGAGALVLGLLVPSMGYALAFAVLAAAMAAAVTLPFTSKVSDGATGPER